MGKRKFSYTKRSYDNARKRAEQSAGSRDVYINEDIKLYKPSEGQNLLRILPPSWDDAEHYGHDLYVHYNIGPDNAAYTCLNKMKGEACPICEERMRAEHEGDKDYARKLKPTKRVLFYLIDRDREGEGVKAWAAPWTVDKEIMIQATDSRSREFFPVDDPEEGFDVKVTRTGSGERTEYSVSIARRPSELELDDDMVDLLEDLPLPEIVKYYEYDRIKQVFEGTAPATTTPDDDKDDKDDKDDDSRSSRRGSERAEKEDQPQFDMSYEEVQGLQGDDLDTVVEETGLDIDPSNYDSDGELADDICDALGLKPARSRRKLKEKEPEKEDDPEPKKEEDDDGGTSTRRSKVTDKLSGLRKRRGK